MGAFFLLVQRSNNGFVDYLAFLSLSVGCYCWWYIGLRLGEANSALRRRSGIRPSERIVLLLRPFEIDASIQQKRIRNSNSGPNSPIATESLNVIYSTEIRRAELPSVESAQSFEDAMSKSMEAALGTLVSVGNPADKLPSSGAKKIYASDSDWRYVVAKTMVGARCILLIPGESPGLTWELRHLRAHINPAKVFVLTLPCTVDEDAQDWANQVLVFRNVGWQLPEQTPGPGSVFAFDEKWSAFLFARGLESAIEMTSAIERRLSDTSYVHPSLQTIQAGAGSIVVCPKCSTRVIPTRTGKCPSCRKRILYTGYDDVESPLEELPAPERSPFDQWQEALRILAWRRIGLSGAILIASTLVVPIMGGLLLYWSFSTGLLEAIDTSQLRRKVPRWLAAILAVVPIGIGLVYFVVASPIFFLLYRLEQTLKAKWSRRCTLQETDLSP
jgi:hypothetical protein